MEAEKFNTIKLEDSSDGSIADVEEDVKVNFEKRKKKIKKKHKKKIYFRSDFTGEKDSYSSSSSEDEDGLYHRKPPDVNPADLSWMMWLWYYIVFASTTTFHAAEYCGEKLADLFGITTPKYQYAIAEYHRLKQEEEDERAAEIREAEYANKIQSSSMTHMEDGPLIA